MNFNDIKELIKLVEASSLSEFNLEQEDIKIHMKKETAIKFVKDESSVSLINNSLNDKTAEENSKVSNEESHIELKEENDMHIIKCPIVGIFYASPDPASRPYAKVGDKVKKGDTLCIIEAMKLMNEITSDEDGEIVEILVENQNPVEYGQPLFKIRKV